MRTRHRQAAARVVATVVISLTAITGRARFYALVIPTTISGVFFTRNRGCEVHAWFMPSQGFKEDYENPVDGHILTSGSPGRMLFHNRP